MVSFIKLFTLIFILLIFLIIYSLYFIQNYYTKIDKISSNYEDLNINQIDFNLISDELKRNVSIFCIIHTSPKYKYSRAIHLKNTWLKRCNDYLFISTENDISLPAIKGFRKDGYQFSNGRIRKGLTYIYKNYGNNYDWFFKVDDDTYAIMENVRMFLMNRDSQTDHYYGYKLKIKDYYKHQIEYMSGGGYLISKETLMKLVTVAFKNPKICSPMPNIPDDVQIGRCLKNINITTMDSRDIYDRHVFLPSSFSEFGSLIKNTHWDGFKKRSYYNLPKGLSALGNFPMSFHYVIGDMQYGLEYLFYHTEVVGRTSRIFNKVYLNKESNTTFILDEIKKYGKSNFKY
ncbi:Glycoprotein-N-acetylgalactosamine 3-beta-galactosyltransferase 1 [Strongyloides ratti]|uniref:N-acetylgalactosaminide beta-1,3-galactosyltransferase n=1 Tax=Strongyloides ratti TaxID=34506 RepID=A0A090LHX3_STRRB|nr:Glycoprotein-N-acetylgalactosamine 3-beta-galactosyltransferase 1 [Strongyloides ratti]CEF69416.1 Glycoprotein-N-acetylgalactosamine 3-beta-galactosyltransferase 1 [Strongyloides ratti]